MTQEDCDDEAVDEYVRLHKSLLAQTFYINLNLLYKTNNNPC